MVENYHCSASCFLYHVAETVDQAVTSKLICTFKPNKQSSAQHGASEEFINTASITAYQGNETLIDYSSSKGAIVSFTRSLALNLANKNIRVNAVAPGPIWTPLIPSSFDAGTVSKFGTETTMKRLGQPVELAGAYLYLACEDSSYVSGQTIHVNGGMIVNG